MWRKICLSFERTLKCHGLSERGPPPGQSLHMSLGGQCLSLSGIQYVNPQPLSSWKPSVALSCCSWLSQNRAPKWLCSHNRWYHSSGCLLPGPGHWEPRPSPIWVRASCIPVSMYSAGFSTLASFGNADGDGETEYKGWSTAFSKQTGGKGSNSHFCNKWCAFPPERRVPRGNTCPHFRHHPWTLIPTRELRQI